MLLAAVLVSVAAQPARKGLRFVRPRGRGSRAAIDPSPLLAIAAGPLVRIAGFSAIQLRFHLLAGES